MVAARQISFEDARRARRPRAAFIVYVLARLGLVTHDDEAVDAFHWAMELTPDALDVEHTAYAIKLRAHIASKPRGEQAASFEHLFGGPV